MDFHQAKHVQFKTNIIEKRDYHKIALLKKKIKKMVDIFRGICERNFIFGAYIYYKKNVCHIFNVKCK